MPKTAKTVQYPKLTEITKTIWKWCEDRNLWIHASYIESQENKEADEQSRILPQDTEWGLADWAFKKIVRKFDIDLFASKLNAKNTFLGTTTLIRQQ